MLLDIPHVGITDGLGVVVAVGVNVRVGTGVRMGPLGVINMELQAKEKRGPNIKRAKSVRYFILDPPFVIIPSLVGRSLKTNKN